MAQEEELPNYYQSFLNRVELPQVAWRGVRDRVYTGCVRPELKLYLCGFGGCPHLMQMAAGGVATPYNYSLSPSFYKETQ